VYGAVENAEGYEDPGGSQVESVDVTGDVKIQDQCVEYRGDLKEVLEVVGYFFIEEADEVCGELMDAGIGVERGEGGVAPFFVGFVDEGGGEFGV